MTISVGHGKGKASQPQTSPSSHVFCFTGYKLRKTDPESSNYLRYRRGNVFSDCDCFCPPFWKRDAADNLSRTRNVHDFWQWFRIVRPKDHTLSSGTSPYSPNKGVPPPRANTLLADRPILVEITWMPVDTLPGLCLLPNVTRQIYKLRL